MLHSDHKMGITQVNLNTFQRGPGPWKFNSALLSEPEFVTEISLRLTLRITKKENPLMAWGLFKVYAKHRRQKECNPQISTAKVARGNKESAASTRNKDLHEKHLQINKKLKLHDIQPAKCAQIRARLNE